MSVRWERSTLKSTYPTDHHQVRSTTAKIRTRVTTTHSSFNTAARFSPTDDARDATFRATEVASMFVALATERLHGDRAGTGPLRCGPTRRTPSGDAVGVGAPVPADRRAVSTDRRAGVRRLGPAFGVVLPRLAATIGRHVEQAERPVGRLVAAAGRGVGEEHAV